MKAEVLAIGTELIIGHTLNTNASYISEILSSVGISVHYHSCVGDNEKRIIECLEIASKRSELVIITGGLGPTDDDITHDTLAKFLNYSISEDPAEREILEKKFKGREIPQINYKQARIIDGAKAIKNPIGTAIGMFITKNQTTYATFPGVPCEMQAMLNLILPDLTEEQAAIVSHKIKMTNITESKMAQIILDYYQQNGLANPFLESNPSLAPYADLGDVYLRITAKAKTSAEAKNLIDEFKKPIEKILANYIYGYDDDTLAKVLAKILVEKQLNIAFAESCTGGLASKIMTDLAGASVYTKVNLVTYSNESKQKFLGVSAETLMSEGAVSDTCAREMVVGLSKISDADINVSITGIAGPDGASEEKPIGTIFVGIVIVGKQGLEIKTHNSGIQKHEEGYFCTVQKLDWAHRPLDREQVRELAVKKVLWILINLLKLGI
jgi:nicotinamide-nucleotide amidase